MELNIISTSEIEKLNAIYGKMTVHKRVEQLYKDFQPDEIMLTSSFAATSPKQT